jgi:hypothetical protein
MNRPFEVYAAKDKIARRRVLFALELLDAVTLDRVSQGVEVTAHGLQGKPIVNASGFFVWLDEDIEQLERISIDPGTQPYEEVELEGPQLQLPLTSIELPPRMDYPFSTGITGLRGTLVEASHEDPPRPVPKAEVHLQWLDQDGIWHDAPTKSHTAEKGGDFVAILRLAPSEIPQLDAKGALTVRLRVKRGADERSSADLKVLQGRVESSSAPNQSVFAWDELEA